MKEENKNKLMFLGVNLEETLERFIDNEDLYFRCLNKFLDDKNYAEMIRCIEAKDAEGAFEASHALKGVSANLGLDKLYSQVKIIVEVFRGGNLDYDENNLQQIKNYYEEVIETIKTM